MLIAYHNDLSFWTKGRARVLVPARKKYIKKYTHYDGSYFLLKSASCYGLFCVIIKQIIPDFSKGTAIREPQLRTNNMQVWQGDWFPPSCNSRSPEIEV